MGKKKQQQHVQQSMGNMVSAAALAQLGPKIEQLVRAHVDSLGNQLTSQQISTFQNILLRLVTLEKLVIEKLGVTAEDLAKRVSDLEDSAEGLESVDTVELGDTVRLEISTKTKDQDRFQGSSLLKLDNTGKGEYLGQELEAALLGMKSNETKEINFGQDGAMVAKLTVNRVSRKVKTQEATNDAQAQG